MIIDYVAMSISLTNSKWLAINFIHLLDSQTTWVKIKKEHLLIHILFKYLNLSTAPSHELNHNKSIHERVLRFIYSSYTSPFQGFLDKNGSVTIHQKYIQALATLMYNVANNMHQS